MAFTSGTQFDRLLEILRADWFLMLDDTFQAYFDESGTDDKSPLVCVAGYLFSRDGAAQFASCWEKEVRPLLPSGVDVFHATDCFRGENERIFEAMVRITKQTMTEGFIVAVAREAYEAEMKRQPKVRGFIGSAYSLCAMRCAENAVGWLDEQKLAGETNFVFEGGYEYGARSRLSFQPSRETGT